MQNRRIGLPAICKDKSEFTGELPVLPTSGAQGPLCTGFVRDLCAQIDARLALEHGEEYLRTLAACGSLAYPWGTSR